MITRSTFFLFLSLFLVISACKKDDDLDDDGNNNNIEIRYDGVQFSAPLLPENVYILGARFPASSLTDVVGKKLSAIDLYLASVPAKTEVRIYEGGTATEPGDLIYSNDVSAAMSTDSWNTVTISPALNIENKDLWLCVMVDHPASFGSLGCDQGPANPNGDFIYDQNSNTWTSLRVFTGGESDINWNIRGVVTE